MTSGASKAPKRGRVTPKGTPPKAKAKGSKGSKVSKRARAKGSGAGRTTGSGRYTAPLPRAAKQSPPWVPVAMFTLLGLGMLLIVLNYVKVFPASPSWGYVAGGLVLILLGILAASQYR